MFDFLNLCLTPVAKRVSIYIPTPKIQNESQENPITALVFGSGKKIRQSDATLNQPYAQ
jgi:hypothetical protein